MGGGGVQHQTAAVCPSGRSIGFHCRRGCLSSSVAVNGFVKEKISCPHGGGGVGTPNYPVRRSRCTGHALPAQKEKVAGRTPSRDASIADTHKIPQYDLCYSLSMFRGYFLQFLIFQQRGHVVPYVIHVASWPSKRSIGRHHNAPLLAESDYFRLVQVRVALNLQQYESLYSLKF